MKQTIAVIGAGHLGRSLIQGLLARGIAAQQLWATARGETSLASLKTQGIHTTVDNTQAAAAAQILILAVKPQDIPEACQGLATTVQQYQPLVISTCAGVTTTSLGQHLGMQLPILRAMPNMAAQVGHSATALFANAHVDHEQRAWAESIFNALGQCWWLEEESLMNAVTALSGSGPAYFFYLMEAMIQAGEDLGLPRQLSQQLTTQTALGAAHLAQDQDPTALRERITSKGGTTEQALGTLAEGDFASLIQRALGAAQRRAQALET